MSERESIYVEDGEKSQTELAKESQLKYEQVTDDSPDDYKEKTHKIEDIGPFERALQKSGRGSLALILPHSWIDREGLEVHDKVFLKWQTDGSLRISPMKGGQRDDAIFLIDAAKLKQPRDLGRSIAAAYVEGFNKIRISSNAGLTKEQHDAVLEYTSKLIGLALISDSPNSVVIKCYLDSYKNDVPQLFVRIYSLSSALLKDSLEAFVDCNPDSVARINGLSVEVNRIYYLILRQLFTAVRDPIVAEALKISRPLNIVSDRAVAKLIVDIGDSCNEACVHRSESAQSISLSKEDLASIHKLNQEILLLYERAFRAYSASDRNLAGWAIDSSKSLERALRELEGSIVESNKHLLAHSLMIEFAIVIRNCRSIAEITFNRAIGMDEENVWNG